MKNIEIVVLLHNIRSIHNVASIFRTADAAGVKKIWLCGITPGPTDRFGRILSQFAKVSLGAERSVKWGVTDEAWRVMDKLKKDGYKIFAVEQSKKSILYYLANKKSSAKKIALVLGNEVRGLPDLVLKKSDRILEIPMAWKKESLNVSVAFGIVVYGLLYK